MTTLLAPPETETAVLSNVKTRDQLPDGAGDARAIVSSGAITGDLLRELT